MPTIILIFILAIFGSIWLISERKEKRNLWNGFFFILFYATLVFGLIILGLDFQWRILSSFGAFLLILSLLFIPLFFISIFFTVISTGITLIRKEGFSLSHSLGLLFGFVILAYFFFLPFFINQLHNQWLSIIFSVLSIYIGYFLFMFIIFMVAVVTYTFFPEKKDKDFIIVLGCSLVGPNPSPLLQQRLDLAIKFYHKQLKQTKKSAIFIMSGGQGSDEVISEAQAMKNYALAQGIPETQIWLEDDSTNTYENMLFSKNMIAKSWEVQEYTSIFITNNFHVFRSGLWAKKVGLNANGIGSPVRFYYYVNAIIREYIGTLKFNWQFHLLIPTIVASLLIIIALLSL